MAGKNQVILTFAGDSKDLDRTVDKLGTGLKKTESAFDSVGSGADRFSKRLGDGNKATGEYSSRIDRVGESADSAETRFTGLASGIDGVTTLMSDPSPQEFAQGIADIGDGIANSAVPAVKSLVEQMGGLKNVALTAAGAAGIGALLFAIHEIGKAAHEAKIKDLADEFEQTGRAAETMQAAVAGDVFEMGNMADVFDALLEKSPALAQSYLDQAEASGLNAEAVASAQKAIDDQADAEERLADSIHGVNDAYRAQSDPLFAAVDASNSLTESQLAITAAYEDLSDATLAYNEAVAEHGKTSEEATDALTSFNEAERAAMQAYVDNSSAAADYESSLLSLEEAVKNGDVSVSSMNATLARWVEQGLITQASAQTTARKFEDVTGAALSVPESVQSTLYANDRATPTIRSIEGAVEDLDGRSATINIGANLGAYVGRILAGGFADGGVVPQYMAVGGMSKGARGSDTVPAWLTPGEMVLNDGQQAELWAMANGHGGGSGSAVNVYVQGSVLSERDLIGVVRAALQRGGLGGLGR